MRDIHTERPKVGPIPILSPAMHCVAMTALVYLRRDFGYAFLRPKAVFFAFTWALVLFCIFAWNEPEVWSEYRFVCIFGAGAASLYWLHLLLTFIRDVKRRGEDDHYSGRSHLLAAGVSDPERVEFYLHVWGEPALVACAGAVLRLLIHERHLSTWLFIVAACLAASEYMNFWSGVIRREKVAKDMAADAEAQTEQLGGAEEGCAFPKASRKDPVKIKRNTSPKP